MTRVYAGDAGAPGVVAYAEDIATWSVLGPYLEAFLKQASSRVRYVTSAPDDPRLSAGTTTFQPFYLARLAPWWIARLEAGVLFTTLPDLGRLHVQRPPPSTPVVYAFHSLISTHQGYRPGAFDHYDVFFCAGPHHRRELEAHFRRIGRPVPELLEVGYARLDRLAARFAARASRVSPHPTVLVAPSWGRGNVLEAAGVDVVAQLRAHGFRVVVRPHPCFWLPIYPEGRAHVQRVIDRFADDPLVQVERHINSEDALLDADLLISDFSGVAYEYAFATRRPVLFFDGARKTLNPGWAELGLPVFEDVMRAEVGEIVTPDHVGDIGRIAESLLRDASRWVDRLAALHTRVVYHPGTSAGVGAAALRDTLARHRTGRHRVSA